MELVLNLVLDLAQEATGLLLVVVVVPAVCVAGSIGIVVVAAGAVRVVVSAAGGAVVV